MHLPSLATYAWTCRLKEALRARFITEKHVNIGQKLRFLLESGGENPTDRELAEGENWCERTVFEARKRLKALNLLDWDHTQQNVGGRWRRGRNRYRLHAPETLVFPDRKPCGARKVSKIKEEVLGNGVPWDAAAAERRMLAHLGAQKAATQARMGSGGRPSS
jgi:hypothetical protein